MERTAVVSSNILSVGYDPATSTLEVEFQSGVYQYYNVPTEIFAGLMQSPSKGSFFDQYIKKGGYPFAKV